MEVLTKSQLADEQRVTILRKADEAPVAEIANGHGISEQTIYNSRSIWAVLIAYL